MWCAHRNCEDGKALEPGLEVQSRDGPLVRPVRQDLLEEHRVVQAERPVESDLVEGHQFMSMFGVAGGRDEQVECAVGALGGGGVVDGLRKQRGWQAVLREGAGALDMNRIGMQFFLHGEGVFF